MGIYGVTSYAVAQRTQEIGIRMALGARMGDVLKLILKGGMSLAVDRSGARHSRRFRTTRVMSSLLLSGANRRGDFRHGSLTLIAVAFVACLFRPTRNEGRSLVALRYE